MKQEHRVSRGEQSIAHPDWQVAFSLDMGPWQSVQPSCIQFSLECFFCGGFGPILSLRPLRRGMNGIAARELCPTLRIIQVGDKVHSYTVPMHPHT